MIIIKPKNLITILGLFLFMILSISGEILLAYNLGNLINNASNGNSKSLFVSILTTIFIIIIYPVTLYFYDLFKNKTVYTLSYNLKQKLFEAIIFQDYLEFKKTDIGEKISIFTNDISIIENDYFLNIIDLFRRFLLFLISFISIFLLSIPLGILLLILSIISIFLPKIIGKNIDKLKKDISISNSSYLENLTECLNGYNLINSFNIQEKVSKKLDYYNKNILTSLITFRKSFSKIQSLSIFLGGLTFMGGFVFGSYLVYIHTLSVGSMITSIQLSNHLTQPIYVITNNMLGIQSIKKIKNKLESYFIKNSFDQKKLPLTENDDVILLKNISYKVNDSYILNHINLNIKNEKKYLLLGESGSGKSTLLNTIFGRINSYDGNICVCQNFNSDKAFIEQNNFLFSGSIKDNIQLFDSSINNTIIKNSLKIVGLEKWIQEIENNDFIKENGKNISGGEIQRLSLARIFARNKKIILFDEATSSLDQKNSFSIEKHLLTLPKVTIIFCTHKFNPSLIKSYDKIIFMQNGNILGFDHYNNLIKNCNEFKKFINLKN